MLENDEHSLSLTNLIFTIRLFKFAFPVNEQNLYGPIFILRYSQNEPTANPSNKIVFTYPDLYALENHMFNLNVTSYSFSVIFPEDFYVKGNFLVNSSEGMKGFVFWTVFMVVSVLTFACYPGLRKNGWVSKIYYKIIGKGVPEMIKDVEKNKEKVVKNLFNELRMRAAIHVDEFAGFKRGLNQERMSIGQQDRCLICQYSFNRKDLVAVLRC